MTDDEKKTAAGLYLSQSANITGLWGIYIAATFTGGAFTFVKGDLNYSEMATVAIGFWSFALGHLWLIWRAMDNATSILERVIKNIPEPAREIDHMVLAITRGAKPGKSIFAHLVIDICVTLLIWRTVLLVW